MKKLLLLGSMSITSIAYAMKEDDISLKESSSDGLHSQKIISQPQAYDTSVSNATLIKRAQEKQDPDAKKVLMDLFNKGLVSDFDVKKIDLVSLFNLNDPQSLSDEALSLVLATCYFQREPLFESITQEIIKRAENGHILAQSTLGSMYRIGLGVKRDDMESVKWLQRAAEKGLSKAQNQLGWAYNTGQGVEQDYEEALKWYRRAAKQNNPSAQYNLALMYENGQGVEKDDKKAVELYSLAAEQRHSGGQYNLGAMHANGRGVEQDYSEAVKWYKLASENGDTSAKERLKKYFNLNLPNDHLSDIPTSETSKDAINELMENLNTMKDQYITLGAASGGGFIDTFPSNEYLKNNSFKIYQEIDPYLNLLNHIMIQPGCLISCLKLKPDYETTNLKKMIVKIDGFHDYLSFEEYSMKALEKSHIKEKIRELKNAYNLAKDFVSKFVNETESSLLDAKMSGALLALDLTKNPLHPFISSFFTGCLNQKTIEEKKKYLTFVIKHIAEREEVLTNHAEFIETLRDQILTILKDTEGYRNALFLSKVWN